jgi:amino acid adenylation domain-containing protein
MNLCSLIIDSALRTPDALAVSGPDSCLSYGELDRSANRCARALGHAGVTFGDRVGIWLDKSAFSVVVMQGVLRLGAIYVPLDPLSPPARIQAIVDDCGIKVIVTSARRRLAVTSHRTALLPSVYLCVDGAEPGLRREDLACFSAPLLPERLSGDHELVYILYTSGSTGTPKGVCISNRNALAFIEWAAVELRATSVDRFSNHAPFHFDLSVLDLYVAFLSGGTVFLIPDGMAYLPTRLVEYLVLEAITIWYSVPSVLILMMEEGGMFELNRGSLRALLFAGEAFPIKHLRLLYEHFPGVRFLNLYGPTETNVCTFYEVLALSQDETSIPIGRPCSGDAVWIRKEDGSCAGVEQEGELMVEGPTVMRGYWGKPAQDGLPYATGDLVRQRADGNYVYLGRRDQMVKLRGYRIEIGDIERSLEHLDGVQEVAVVVIGEGLQARLISFLVLKKGEKLSLLDVKRHCAAHLPRYMIVDAIRILPALPRTRNGKVDRLLLQNTS